MLSVARRHKHRDNTNKVMTAHRSKPMLATEATHVKTSKTGRLSFCFGKHSWQQRASF
jgi:hypothetical protein